MRSTAFVTALAACTLPAAAAPSIAIGHGLPLQGGYAHTTGPSVNLTITTTPPATDAVLVNGVAAEFQPGPVWLAAAVALNPGINRVVVRAFDTAGKEIDRSTVDIWSERGAGTIVAGGTLSADATWSPASGPYRVTGSLTVPAGRVLTIEPGASVYFGGNVKLTINGGLRAQGTEHQRIRFTRVPGTTSNWSGLSFHDTAVQSVLGYTDVEYGDTDSRVIYIGNADVLIDHATVLNNNTQNFEIWEPRVIIRNSVFGDIGAHYGAKVEHMIAGGWFIVDGNLFGTDTGDNDIFHLNRVSLKGGPVAQILNNVFLGAGDDIVDDNETDTHIEGNLFMRANIGNSGRSASAAVTTGPGGSTGVANLRTQHLTVVRNVFFQNDYAILCKTGAYSAIYNNVFVGNRGALLFDEPWRSDASPGRAAYVESCIFWNNQPENDTNGSGTFVYVNNDLPDGHTQLTVDNSLVLSQFHGYGTGNIDVDPALAAPSLDFDLNAKMPRFGAGFEGFDAGPYLMEIGGIPDMHLGAGSPCRGTGYNGVDMGAYVPTVASLSGVPASPTALTEATLTVAGTDIAGYKYRVVGPGFSGAWSPELMQVKVVNQITRSGSTATATTAEAHGYADGDVIEVTGAEREAFNGRFTIADVTATAFSYTVAGTPENQSPPKDISCRKPQPIHLTGLADGTYTVYAIKKSSIGVWQDEAAATTATWTVATVPPPVIASVTPAEAKAGENVAIAGSGFHAGLQVFFGAASAASVVFDEIADPGLITATVPAIPSGSAPVTVRNSDGGVSAPAAFTVIGPPRFTRGDVNVDGRIDISDAVGILTFLFASKTVACVKAVDANDDGETNIADCIYLLGYLFAKGPMVPAPFGACGADPTEDALTCESFPQCP